ncbi:uncharacterized protein LOC116300763 [Actinia tenebrosa]|uniref:Uncharacterized protein LOC116300763 n=1 Tax=Actinia tenebrosa TaxID=6105 RepID=A0A6P8IFN1_ACTTE|nr:uncharacterized protein LOC116300763 [Actinia tenebrosa]
MELIPEPISIYISIGLVSFLALIWCISICCCKGPCREFKIPVASTFEAHLSPALRNSSLKSKYDQYYYRLLGGKRIPYTSSRGQAKSTNDGSPYLVPTPFAGLTSDQLPLRNRSGYENEERSCSMESVYSQDSDPVNVNPAIKKSPQESRSIPTIKVTSGTSSETTPNETDESRRSSEEQRERKPTQFTRESESSA